MAACPDGSWEVYYDGTCYVDQDAYTFVQHPDMTPGMVEYIRKSRKKVPGLAEHMRENKIGVEKLHMVFSDTEKRNKMLEQMKRHRELDVSYATTFNLEIISAKSGKGRPSGAETETGNRAGRDYGLRRCAQRLGYAEKSRFSSCNGKWR